MFYFMLDYRKKTELFEPIFDITKSDLLQK